MRQHIAACSALTALAGCALSSPDSRVGVMLPPPPSGAPIVPSAGPPQYFYKAAIPPANWWRAFGSSKLDALVSQALTANNDLAAAEATLRQAEEQAAGTRGAQGLQIDANYQTQRARISQTLSTPLAASPSYLYTLHTAQLTVGYPLDLFGGGRSRIRSARAQAEVAAYRLTAARTMVAANLTLAVIQNASLLAQIGATLSTIQSNRELVALLQRRRALGDVGESDVSAQEASLASAEAALPPLQRQVEHQRALVQTITGVPAGSPHLLLPTIEELSLPSNLPLSLPGAVIANRPDVRAADAQMRGAAADVGTAIAARLPALQLTGNGGASATRLLDLFGPATTFWTLIGSVTQPIFHSGQLLHQQRAAEAALNGAKAQYRTAALQAFMDVDDALTALRTDAVALDAAERANSVARRTLMFARRQVELGAIGTLALLNASAIAAQTSNQVAQSRAARLVDTVALFQASGSAPPDS